MLRAMSFPAPPAPRFPDTQAATTQGHLRYEDCSQAGRLQVAALPPALGGLWREVVARHPGARNVIASGVVPVLTRLVLATEDQPIRIDRPYEAHAGFELAHDRDADGAVTRLFMNVWCDLHGITGRVERGPSQPEGALVPAGRVFAEHTFTRLFAPPDQRKVLQLDAPGYPAVPSTHYPAASPHTAHEAPAGATWLDDLAEDPTDLVFTVDHTDANQHVNSLVYVRTFLDAAQRRLAVTGRSLQVRTRAVDIAYRKPCFAGDHVRVRVRLFALGAEVGAAGMIVGADDKPRCYVRALFTD